MGARDKVGARAGLRFGVKVRVRVRVRIRVRIRVWINDRVRINDRLIPYNQHHFQSCPTRFPETLADRVRVRC